MTTKINEKYGTFGLYKTDGITTYHGHGINVLPDASKVTLTNYGLFVMMTRELATPKDTPLTDAEKQAKLDECWAWLMDGCPKTNRATGTGRLQADINEATERLTTYATILATAKGAAKSGIEALFAKDWENLEKLQNALNKKKA